MDEIKLRIHQYPKMVQEFARANFNLKMLLSAILGLFFISLILIIYLVRKGPIVVALDGSGQVTTLQDRVTDTQIQAALSEYIKYRYTWDDKSIQSRIQTAQYFVLLDLASSFEKSMNEVIKYVRDKKIKQRVYVKSVSLDLKLKKALFIIDRITEIESLRAATEMKLELEFTLDRRTILNPWGVFVTKEIEGSFK